jgi:hypothetical protein
MSVDYSIVVASRDNNWHLDNFLESLASSDNLGRKDLECIIVDNSDIGNSETHELCRWGIYCIY